MTQQRKAAAITGVVLVMCFFSLISCSHGKSAPRTKAPVYQIGSAEFNNATPSEFHDLKIGMSEEDVIKAVGKPNSRLDLSQLSQGKSKGWQSGYYLDRMIEKIPEGPGHELKSGTVYVLYDKGTKVTGIFYIPNRGMIYY